MTILYSLDAVTSPWIRPTLSGTWIEWNDNSGNTTSGYRISPNGLVSLKGIIENGAAPSSAIFTLPAGYRPQFSISFDGACWDGSAVVSMWISVSSAGVVTFSGIGGTWSTTTGFLMLDSIHFYVDAARQ